MMQRRIGLFLDVASSVAVAVWLGGVVACWILLAQAVHEMPASILPVGQLVLAGALRRLGVVVEVCGISIVAIQWLTRRRYARDQAFFVADGVRTLFLFVGFFAAEYGRYLAIPVYARTQSPTALSTLTVLAAAQIAALVVFIAITAWIQLPKTPAPARKRAR